MDFIVTLCLCRGDGGDVCVSVDVSDEEYELLKKCCHEDEEIDGYPGLEELCESIIEAAKDENECCMMDFESDEEIDYDNISYIIHMPSGLDDDDDDDEDEDEESDEWEDYFGYPFAMEVVNGEILSMTEEVQIMLKQQILEKLKVTEKELVAYLVKLSEDAESDDERFEPIGDCGFDALSELLGFCDDDGSFTPEGIGFLGSPYGWEAKEMMENLDIDFCENINYGPHGHGTTGVVYIPE